MTRRFAALALFCALLLTGLSARAACTNPAGAESQIIYNADHHVLQFCNGTNWISMASSGATSLPGGSPGVIQFNNNDTFGGNVKLFWDNAFERLGVGTSSPAQTLDVAGTAAISGAVTMGNTLAVTGDTTLSGSVGIGTATPGSLLDVGGGGQGHVLRIKGAIYNQVNIAHAANAGWGLLLTNSDGNLDANYHHSTSGADNSAAIVNVNNDALHFGTSNTARMTIDHNGNVGIGTVSPGYPLHVRAPSAAWAGYFDGSSGAFFRGTSTYGLYASHAGLNSGVGVYGTTLGVGGIAVQGYCFGPSCAGGHFTGMGFGSYSGTINGYYGYVGHPGGYSLYGNGNTWIAGSYTGSDARLKENIHDMDKGHALAELEKLNPVSFMWKPNSEQARTHKGTRYGLIAQEARKVLPHIVTESQPPVPPNADKAKLTLNQRLGKVLGIDYTSLVPWLLAGLQELKAASDNQAAVLKAANDDLAALRALVEKQGREIKALRAARR